jgi:hypothetical protein
MTRVLTTAAIVPCEPVVAEVMLYVPCHAAAAKMLPPLRL